MGRGQTHNTQTHKQTLLLLDQFGPEGRVGEKINPLKQILVYLYVHHVHINLQVNSLFIIIYETIQVKKKLLQS